jgi:hypothetical protein
VPAGLDRICRKALAPEAGQRYPSARALALELRRYVRRGARRWLVAGVVLGLLGLLAAGGLVWQLGRLRQQHDTPAPAASPPLSGELSVEFWTPGGKGKRGLRYDAPGALPARFGEGFQVEVKLNQPGHVYLLLLGSQGEVAPLYPWNMVKIVEEDPSARPPLRKPVRVLRSPTEEDDPGDDSLLWELDDKDGLETVLLLARRTPLPAEVRLGEVIGRPPAARLRDRLEWAVRGGDEGQAVGHVDVGDHRGIKQDAKRIDDPLIQVMGRLRKHFEVVKAVRFAHVGK